MRTHSRFSRGLALASCGALASGLAFLPAGPASAAPPVSVYLGQATTSADPSCTAPVGTTSQTVGPKTLHQGQAKGAVNLGTAWTSGSNSSDVTTVSGHYSGKAQAVKKHGAFRSASLTGSGHFSISRALGSASTCDVSVQLINAIELVTVQPAGWYYVTRSTTKSALTETIVEPGDTIEATSPVVFEVYQGGRNTVTQRAYVKHGQYLTVFATGIEGGDFPILLGKNGSTVSRGSNTNTITAVFHNAGSALSGAKGSATGFVKFPAAVSCSHHSAALTWKGSASQVASSTFYVNGKKKASVSNPNTGHHVVLHHLGASADNKITVKLSLKNGGKATAADMYVPCHE